MFEAFFGNSFSMFIYRSLVDEAVRVNLSVLEFPKTFGSDNDREATLDIVQEEFSDNWDGFVSKSCILVSLFELEFELLDPDLLGNLG